VLFFTGEALIAPPSSDRSDSSQNSVNICWKGDMPLIEVIANDRLGRKVRVKCSPDDTVGDLKKLIAAQTGTDWKKIQLKKWYNIYKDHITLADYEIHDGMSLEMY